MHASIQTEHYGYPDIPEGALEDLIALMKSTPNEGGVDITAYTAWEWNRARKAVAAAQGRVPMKWRTKNISKVIAMWQKRER